MNVKRSSSIVVICALSLAMFALTGCPSREAAQGQSLPAAQGKPAGDVWTDDIEGAFKAAADSGKPVFIDFTGSDWCGWCKLADENIFSTPAWADFADEVICLKVDFPRSGRPDATTEAPARTTPPPIMTAGRSSLFRSAAASSRAGSS